MLQCSGFDQLLVKKSEQILSKRRLHGFLRVWNMTLNECLHFIFQEEDGIEGEFGDSEDEMVKDDR